MADWCTHRRGQVTRRRFCLGKAQNFDDHRVSAVLCRRTYRSPFVDRTLRHNQSDSQASSCVTKVH